MSFTNHFFYKTFLIPTLLTITGYISFTFVQNEIAWDLSRYMTYALNIFSGKGYVDMDGSQVFFRGPMFPLMIAMSYSLFGISALSALGVVKLFCVLNPILLYFFGRKIFCEKVGIASALLVLTSYAINYWSFQFIDGIWPFFVILHCLFLYMGFEEQDKNKIRYFILSGLALGCAYLTKEVAVLFFPLGLLMFFWVKEYRSKYNFFGVCLALLTTFAVLLPWAIYLIRNDAFYDLLGTGGPVVLDDMAAPALLASNLLDIISVVKKYLSAFVYFYAGQRNTLVMNFAIAPLFLVGWIIVIIRAFRGNKGCKLLSLYLLMSLPMVYFIGNNHWRFGQVLFLMLISYMALSSSIFSLVENVCKLLTFHRAMNLIFVLIISIMISVQLFGRKNDDIGLVRSLQKTVFYNLITKNELHSPNINGAFGSEYFLDTIEKIEHLKWEKGTTILADSYWAARNIHFYMEGKVPVSALPIIWYRKNKLILGNLPSNKNEKPLFLSSNNLALDPQYRIYLLFQSQVFEMIKKTQAKYMVLSPTFNSLRSYFSNSVNFQLLHAVEGPDDTQNHYIYEINDTLIYEEHPSIFSDNIVLTLNELRNKQLEKFDQIRENILVKVASLSESEVSLMIESVDNIPGYHLEIANQYYQEGRIEEAIKEYEIAVNLEPENLRLRYQLGRIYIETDQFGPALVQYKKIQQIDPNNLGITSQLAVLYFKNSQYMMAEKEYQEAAILYPENANVHFMLALISQKSGSIKKAERHIKKALSLKPDIGVFHSFLGEIYKKNGRIDEAEQHYMTAIRLEPEKSKNHYLLGRLYQESGFLDKAKIYLQNACDLDPEKGSYHRFLGDLYKEKGAFYKAREQYKKATKLEPENGGHYYALGVINQRIGLYKDAKIQFQLAIQLEPENAWYHRFLGQLYELMAQPGEALKQYQIAIQLDSEIPSFHYLLGKLYQKMDLPLEAYESYKRLLRLDPTNPNYKSLLKQFEVVEVSSAE